MHACIQAYIHTQIIFEYDDILYIDGIHEPSRSRFVGFSIPSAILHSLIAHMQYVQLMGSNYSNLPQYSKQNNITHTLCQPYNLNNCRY